MTYRRNIRSAISLIECLIVLSILSLLFQLMLPAIQNAREATRRVHCHNNLRQLGLAVISYEGARRHYPSAFTLRPQPHNFVPQLMPYMELATLRKQYQYGHAWDSQRNRSATETEVALLRCPSAFSDAQYASDYAICLRMTTKLHDEFVAEKAFSGRSTTEGLLQKGRKTKASQVTDGLSNTILFTEVAGRPDRYRFGELVRGKSSGARWADPESRFDIRHRCDGTVRDQGMQLINCSNDNEIYSFHPGGADFVMADGSVHFFEQEIHPDVLLSKITASADD